VLTAAEALERVWLGFGSLRLGRCWTVVLRTYRVHRLTARAVRVSTAVIAGHRAFLVIRLRTKILVALVRMRVAYCFELSRRQCLSQASSQEDEVLAVHPLRLWRTVLFLLAPATAV